MEPSELIRENKWPVVFGVVGVSLIGFGIWQSLHEEMTQDSTVVIEAQEIASPTPVVKKILVDIAGAVEKPGLYDFEIGSRVNEALVAAGGLAASANRDYVSRNVNLAEVLVDGSKLYIPHKDDPLSTLMTVNETMEKGSMVVQINTAGISELEQLWGVGTVRAQQIIDNRPYVTLSELVTKAKIPQNVLDRNEGKIQL